MVGLGVCEVGDGLGRFLTGRASRPVFSGVMASVEIDYCRRDRIATNQPRDGNSIFYEFGANELSRALYVIPVLGGNPR